MKFPYIWNSKKTHGEFYQKKCRILRLLEASAKTESFSYSIDIEFEDGTLIKSSRNHLRRIGNQKIKI